MYVSQNGVCAICGKPETEKSRKGNVRSLHVDHNHDTGKVRGLLCGKCNRSIGVLGDSVQILRNAVKYLEHYEAQT